MNKHYPLNFHDAFFNWFISQLTFARLLLTCILPPDLLEELDLSTLSIAPPDHTDGRLRRHRADVLFTVRTRSGKTVLLFLLLEHKSYRDPNASLQVLRYIVHLSEDWLRQKKNAALHSAGGALQRPSALEGRTITPSDLQRPSKMRRSLPAVQRACTGPAADGR